MVDQDNPLQAAAAQEAIAKGDWRSLGALFDDGDTKEVGLSDPPTPALDPKPLIPRVNLASILKDHNNDKTWVGEYVTLGLDPKNQEALEKAKGILRKRRIAEEEILFQAALMVGTTVMAKENRAKQPLIQESPRMVPIPRTEMRIPQEIDDEVFQSISQRLEEGQKIRSEDIRKDLGISRHTFNNVTSRLRASGRLKSLKDEAKESKIELITKALDSWHAEHPGQTPNLGEIMRDLKIDPGYGRHLLRELRKQQT